MIEAKPEKVLPLFFWRYHLCYNLAMIHKKIWLTGIMMWFVFFAMMAVGSTEDSSDLVILPRDDPAVPSQNTSCPIMSSNETLNYFIIYEGKKYGLCCQTCVDIFKKN